jgi:hypothetical protein
MDLAGDVADAVLEIARVRAAVEAHAVGREQKAEAELRIVAGFEAAILDAWRAYRAEPAALTRRAVRTQLERWRGVWLYGPASD